MKKREEMTPEEIQEFMRREQEELDKMLGKAQTVPAPALAEEEQEEEVLSFDPATGQAVQVESTIITRETPKKTIVNDSHIQVKGKVKLEGARFEKLSVFEEALQRKAANELYVKYRDLVWEMETKIDDDMRKFLSEDERNQMMETLDKWLHDCRQLKNVGSGVKDVKDLKEVHQELVREKMKEYANELLDIL